MTDLMEGKRLLLCGLVLILTAAALSAALIILLRPILKRYALARPNARSSHREPTPQGGGFAVITATLVVFLLGIISLPHVGRETTEQLLAIVAATLLIALVGAIDDITDLRIGVRLPLQVLAVMIAISSLSSEVRVISPLPFWLERSMLIIGAVYFVNVVNFMDGIDWITVAEVVPITFGLLIMGVLGALPWHGMLIALALLGATIGFAPFNQPVARIFLGDVGSLPIGLLLGLLLLLVASEGHWAASILLPLYYLADATCTLLRRVTGGERFWHAHRSHFYQRATERGFSVLQIDLRIFAVNSALILLAVSTLLTSSLSIDLAALTLGSCLVGWLLFNFARGKR
jgi:UDP-N-acetylmuramyl pentapeptide phosphotransferase/UDP-N-acetylglucosamine-1-phosphate transferase